MYRYLLVASYLALFPEDIEVVYIIVFRVQILRDSSKSTFSLQLLALLGCRLDWKPAYWIPSKISPWRYDDLKRQYKADAGTNKTSSECSCCHDAKCVDYVLHDVTHEKCHDSEDDENLLRKQVSKMLTFKVLYPHISKLN